MNEILERLKTNIAPLKTKFAPLRAKFRPREHFLVLEVTPRGTSGMVLGVDHEKNICIEKRLSAVDIKKLVNSPARRLRERTGDRAFFKSPTVVVSADPALATTIPIPLELIRENAKEELGLPELENHIAQAMAKIFNQCRSEAAKRLNLDELNVILVGAKARHFKVDGHAVVNPVGFTGKKISLVLELTFTTREMFESLKVFFNASNDFFFAEAPQALLMSLARVRDFPINMIVANPGGAGLYVLQKTSHDYPVLYREKMAWDFEALFQKIAIEIGVSSVTARELYRMYEAEELSETAAKAFKRILDPVMEDLFAEIERGKVRGVTYLDVPMPVPFDLPHRRRGLLFEELPIDEMLEQLGFSGIVSESMPSATLARHILPFIEAYFDKSNSEINQKLHRRLHWLAE